MRKAVRLRLSSGPGVQFWNGPRERPLVALVLSCLFKVTSHLPCCQCQSPAEYRRAVAALVLVCLAPHALSTYMST